MKRFRRLFPNFREYDGSKRVFEALPPLLLKLSQEMQIKGKYLDRREKKG